MNGHRLRLALEPSLAGRYGPEIHWVWRLLLTGAGWAWEEVPPESPCDIAYVSEPAAAPSARLRVRADPVVWARAATLRLAGAASHDGLMHSVFAQDREAAYPLQRGDGWVECQRDLIFDVYWLATGQEERHWPQDRHGFFDLTGTPMLRQGILRRALASQIGAWLEETLRGLGLPAPEPRWPHGKRAAAGVGHDVDYPESLRWLEPLRVLRRLGRRGIGPALEVLVGRRTHWHFPNWVNLEKGMGIRSAFYFVARRGSLLAYAAGTPDPFYDITSERFRRLFRYLADEGFEIGLQASYLAYQRREKFAAEKERLEEASGQKVVGNHHHYWHLHPTNPEETLLIHEQIGLLYDSSLAHDRYLGWRRALAQPFFPFHQAERRELRTLQLPLAWMDDQLFGQRAYNPGDRMALLQDLADRAARLGGSLVIDVHEYVWDDALFPDWARTYRGLLEYLRERGDFWLATPAEIAQHWAARYTALVRASRGLRKGM